MRWLGSVVVLVALVATASAESPPRYRMADNIFTRIDDAFGAPQTPHPAVVRVISPERDGVSLGSGTLIDVNQTHGLVITNWHVVRDGSGEVWVVFPDGFRSPGYVLKTDESWDLAAVAVQKPNVAPVKISAEPAKPGEMLTIAGYGRGKYRSASGKCTQYVAPDTSSPFEMVEVAVSARQGDSGGPILNSKGEMAGVLFGEGGGRTAGSYCGRVHRFLASMQVTPRQEAAMLAVVPPRSASSVPPDRVASMTTIMPTALPEHTSPAAAQFASIEQPAWREASLEPAASLSSTLPARAAAPPAWMAHDTVASDVLGNDEPVSPPPSLTVDWRQIAGDTASEQIKTALATVGALALAIHGLRWLRTG